MDAQRRRRDFAQNIAISLLSVSAVLLFARTQVYNLSTEGGLWQQLVGTTAASGVSAPLEESPLAAPVHVAVTGVYGRYGELQLTTADSAFVPLSSLLGEALGSARSLSPCDAAAFRGALDQVSVYYDFLEPLPLSILAALAGEPSVTASTSARRVVIAAVDGDIQLFLWDGDDTYLSCGTAVTAADLSALIDSYELGGASFALDDLETDAHYGAIDPYSLFLTPTPSLPVLSAADPLTNTDALLSALDFNPYTNNRYTETDGTELIREEDRSLRVQTDGTIRYQSSSDSAVEIDSADTLWEAADGTAALLNRLLSGAAGDASLYLQEIRQEGQATLLCFGYQIGGIPIRFSDGGSAAEVTLSGGVVTALTLRFRQYTATDQTSLLLPLKQALAIAAEHPGSELAIGYADSGGDTLAAGWLAN